MKKSRNFFNGKIMDIHTHCEGFDFCNFVNFIKPVTQETKELSQIISKSEIDFAFSSSIPETTYFTHESYINNKQFSPSYTSDFPFEIENKTLLKEIEKLENQNILPFMNFSLRDRVHEQVVFLQEMVDTTYVYGLKYHTECDKNSAIEIEKYPELISFIEKNSLPILFHTGKTRVSDPVAVLRFAQNHPDINVAVAHLGRFNSLFWQEFHENRKLYDNVFLDVSPYNLLLDITEKEKITAMPFWGERCSGDKNALLKVLFENYENNIVWGSDMPWIDYQRTNDVLKQMHTYDEVVNTLFDQDSKIVKKIASENILRFIYK